MSFDLILMKADRTMDSPEAAAAAGEPIGSVEEVLKQIQHVFPNADVSDPGWVSCGGNGFLLEFNIGEESPVRMITLHIYGPDRAAGDIHRLCKRTGWRAAQSTERFIDLEQELPLDLEKWHTGGEDVPTV